MHGSNGTSRRGAWGVVIIVLLVGVHLVRDGTREWRAGGPPRPSAAAAPDHAGLAAGRTPRNDARNATDAPRAPGPLPASRPERVRVPSIRVDAPLKEVGLDSEGWIDTPPAYEKNLAGWFGGAVTPGEKGTAVVVGHVDTPDGRAVFFRLGALDKGQHVEIVRADGRTAVFSVYGVEVVPKDRFPAERIYRNTSRPELRLITCGGAFAQRTGYEDNIVVSARLVDVRIPASRPISRGSATPRRSVAVPADAGTSVGGPHPR